MDKEPSYRCYGETSISKIIFADSMLYQSNLFRNTIRLRHYSPMDKKMVSSVFQTGILFKAKLAFLLLIMTLV